MEKIISSTKAKYFKLTAKNRIFVWVIVICAILIVYRIFQVF